MEQHSKASAHTDASLQPLRESDIDAVISLARSIWVSHYVTMLSNAQIEYMLARRYTAENLRLYLNAADRWLEILRLGTEPVGYCSYALTETSRELKLEQLYLLAEFHGRCLGRLMMQHIESRAHALGCQSVMLQVNKRNSGAIAIYLRSGFTVREEAVFDIGHGYVMDDFIMEKRLVSCSYVSPSLSRDAVRSALPPA